MRAALPVRQVEKIWGMDILPAPFLAPEGQRIGEIWFEPPAAQHGLLVKYIFTSEALSVQVHPSDAQTIAKNGIKQGKEECWLIVAAEPGAKLGIGFNRAIDEDAMRAAALDGSIENLLTWHEVQPGDFFYIPANTVHAIGSGIGLIEVQQNSDITYRLYDYGRPRELHLEEGIAVSHGETYDLARWHRRVPATGSHLLVEGPLFLMDQVEGTPSPEIAARYAGALLVIPRQGDVTIGNDRIAPGGCGVAASLAEICFADKGVCLLTMPLENTR